MTTIPILQAVDVQVKFPNQAVPAVDGVSLDVNPGARIGIVGESGSGKTTLGRVLVGALRPQSGAILVNGRDWAGVKRTDPARRRVQMIFQNPYGALNPWLTSRRTVSEVFQVTQRMTRAEADECAVALLSEVGLTGQAIDKRPAQMSGGQCQRVGIARALACEPQVIVADEPTSALDVSVQAQILNLLQALQMRHGLALVLISHDLGVVRCLADQVLVMHRGVVVESGPVETLFAAPTQAYTQKLVDSIPGGPLTRVLDA